MKSTEPEDTFKALKKLPFEEFRVLRHTKYHFEAVEYIPESFFEKYGWTHKEYINELRRRNRHRRGNV